MEDDVVNSVYVDCSTEFCRRRTTEASPLTFFLGRQLFLLRRWCIVHSVSPVHCNIYWHEYEFIGRYY